MLATGRPWCLPTRPNNTTTHPATSRWGPQRAGSRRAGAAFASAQEQGPGDVQGPEEVSTSAGASSSSSSSSGATPPAPRPLRRDRPAGPDDSPLKDQNLELLRGLLTERAAKTLIYYLMETNLTLHSWMFAYLKANPIPREGSWEAISGDAFLRRLLGSPLEVFKYDFNGRDEMFSCAGNIGVDPRSIAQRVMDIRAQVAKEWIQELEQVSEENALLMRETVTSSFTLNNVVEGPNAQKSSHPEMQEVYADAAGGPDDSAGGSDD